MEQNQVIEKYRSLFKKLSKYYHKVIRDFDLDDIHDFRVEIKKLKAFIRLMNMATPDEQHKLPGSLKSFYNVIGNLRSLKLHHQRIISLCEELVVGKPENYLKELSKQKKYWRKTALQIAEDISLKDFENKLVHNTSENIDAKVINNFIVKYKNKLEHLISLRFYLDQTLHDIRKTLKDIMYNWSYVQAGAGILLPGEWRELKSIESAASKLGDFYDLCVSIQLLHLYFPAQTDQEETAALGKLEAHLQLHKTELKTEIKNWLLPIKRQFQNEKFLLQAQEIL